MNRMQPHTICPVCCVCHRRAFCRYLKLKKINSVRQWKQFNAFELWVHSLLGCSMLCILRIRHVGRRWLTSLIVLLCFSLLSDLIFALYDWRLSGRAWHVLGHPVPHQQPLSLLLFSLLCRVLMSLWKRQKGRRRARTESHSVVSLPRESEEERGRARQSERESASVHFLLSRGLLV